MNAISALIRTVVRHWLWIALGTCVVLLGAANYIEHVDGIRPCHLCLEQRKAYWAGGGIALVGAAVGCTRWGPRTFRIFCALLAVAFAYGLWQSVFQTGGEYHWWTLPESCEADPHAKPVTAENLKGLLDGSFIPQIVNCGKPAWWFPHIGEFKGLTMAAWNAIISFKLVAWSLFAAWRGQKK